MLIELDPTDSEQAFERAQTTLANSVRQVHQQMINVRQYKANIELQQITLDQAISDLNRREALGRANAIGREDLQHARDQVSSAKASLEATKQQYAAAQALVLNTPLEQQPAIAQAATDLRNAWLALKRTNIVSPVDGYVSRRSVQLGARITPSSSLMAVVPAAPLWVDANFKETQLANMRIGQPATVTSDLYGDNVVYKGKVVGLDMGTGSAFSLLPAQNATGNWIKVVQRLPVRIELDPKQLADNPLRIGLSMLVSVDTANTDGRVLSDASRTTPAYQSDALDLDLTPVNQMIDQIISANAG
ncbi:multidrug efflux MFS transporter periplasmic adaptor subunit EmrA [Dickeya oryzae]